MASNDSKASLDLGVFLPTKSNGWIHSVNAPYTPGSYDHVKQVAVMAEELGFDFLLSPANWRGRKGPSRNSVDSLEAVTATAGLLEATDHIQVWCTAHVTVFPPPTIAKMMTTLDQIGPGRTGFNIVTGGSYLDLAHLGMWNGDLDHDQKYDYAEEWINVVKGLWTEETLVHDGEFFHIDGGTMGPKPSKMPTLINAGASPRGLRFAAENCDVAFLALSDEDSSLASARRAKATARELGHPEVKIYGVCSLVLGETDEEAQAKLAHIEAGTDYISLDDVAQGYQKNPDFAKLSAESLAVTGGEKKSPLLPGTMVGSYETLAARLARIALEGEVDGILFTVPDYIDDLRALAERTLPLLAEHGVSTSFTR